MPLFYTDLPLASCHSTASPHCSTVGRVAGGVREVDDHARADEELVQIQAGDVLARGVKVDLAVQVGAQVVGVGQELAVGLVISNCDIRWRFLAARYPLKM